MNRNEKVRWAVVVMVVAALMALMFLGCDLARDALGVQKSPTEPDINIVAAWSWDQRPNNMVVDFTNESTGPFTESFWDFGDGENSRDEDPEHEYDEAGAYTVRLRVCPTIDRQDPLCDDEVKRVDVRARH